MPRGRPRKVEESEVEEGFAPENVDDGVMRDEKKENPIDRIDIGGKRQRVKGDWKSVSHEEMVKLEKEGKLVGYDQETGEVLIKK